MTADPGRGGKLEYFGDKRKSDRLLLRHN